MARAYSDDLRRKLLESYDLGTGPLHQLAGQFGVSLAWAEKISSARKRTGSTDRPLYCPGPKGTGGSRGGAGHPVGEACSVPTRGAGGVESIDRRGREHAPSVEDRRPTRLSWLKKSLHAPERDTEANRLRREAFVERLCGIDPERLIVLDESGVSTQMATPQGNWKIHTILGAMSTHGLIATMTVEAATDAEIFLTYLDHVLCPALRSGNVMVMDHLSSHKVAGVRERIEAAGAELLLSAASIRLTSTRSRRRGQISNSSSAPPEQGSPDQTITKLIPTIRKQDATAWFRIPFTALHNS